MSNCPFALRARPVASRTRVWIGCSTYVQIYIYVGYGQIYGKSWRDLPRQLVQTLYCDSCGGEERAGGMVEVDGQKNFNTASPNPNLVT